MKKLLTLLATLAVACTLSMPVFAAPKKSSQGTTQSETHKKSKTKKHTHHASKKAAHKGKKKGQK